MDKEKNILSDEELEKAAGGFSVYEDDSCDRFELSFICSMFGGSYDKTCKNCDHFKHIAMSDDISLKKGGICNAK